MDAVKSVLGVKCYKPTLKDHLFDCIFLFCRLQDIIHRTYFRIFISWFGCLNLLNLPDPFSEMTWSNVAVDKRLLYSDVSFCCRSSSDLFHWLYALADLQSLISSVLMKTEDLE